MKHTIDALMKASSKPLHTKIMQNTFGGNVKKNDWFSKFMSAICELVDNGLGAYAAMMVAELRIYIIDLVDSIHIVVKNQGKPIEEEAIRLYGAESKNGKSTFSSFGTGLKNAVSALQAVRAIIMTRSRGKVFGYDLTEWVGGGKTLGPISEDEWDYGQEFTTAVDIVVKDADIMKELRTIKKEDFGVFYWAMLKSDWNKTNLYFNDEMVFPWEIDGDLIYESNEIINIKGVDLIVERWDYKLNDTAKNAKYFAKNANGHGIVLFANGRFVAHPGASLLMAINKSGMLQAHGNQNCGLIVLNVLFDEKHRECDLPYEDNNKTVINWESEVGQEYVKEFNRIIGESFRKMMKEKAFQVKSEIDTYLLNGIGSYSPDDDFSACSKSVSLKKYGREEKLCLAVGHATIAKDGDIKTRTAKLINGEMEEVSVPLKSLDIETISEVYEIVPKSKVLSYEDVYSLIAKVMAVADITGNTPEGFIMCQHERGNSKSLAEAKKVYKKVTKKNVNIISY